MRELKTIGRPREFDEDEALGKIMDVFWAKGYEGASMSDIVAATGLKKGSLYAAFGDKRALYLQAIARYDRTAIDKAVRRLVGPGDPETRIRSFLRSAIDAVRNDGDRRGCFLCNASIDQSGGSDEDARGAIQASLARLERALESALAETTALVGDDRTRKAEARHLVSVYVGMRVLARAGYALRALDDARRQALAALRPAS